MNNVEELSISVAFQVKPGWVNKDLAKCELVVSLMLCAAMFNCTLKVVLCCFNLGWISLSITDGVFCVKHA